MGLRNVTFKHLILLILLTGYSFARFTSDDSTALAATEVSSSSSSSPVKKSSSKNRHSSKNKSNHKSNSKNKSKSKSKKGTSQANSSSEDSTGTSGLSTDINFNDLTVNGLRQSPLGLTTTVENDKGIPHLIDYRADFRDRVNRSATGR